MNPMKEIRIEKVTLNIGAGRDQSQVDRGAALLKYIGGGKPVKTTTQKRIQEWGLRPGLPIGAKLTVRKDKAQELLKKLLEASEFRLSQKQFDNHGNFSFGIKEYIDIPSVKYNPDLGILGFEVAVTLQRPGYRIKRRRLKSQRITPRHDISKDDAISYMKENFGVKIIEEEKEE